jgi:hypothetical protein
MHIINVSLIKIEFLFLWTVINSIHKMQKLNIEDLAPCLKKSKLCTEFSEDDSKLIMIPNKYMMGNFVVTKGVYN